MKQKFRDMQVIWTLLVAAGLGLLVAGFLAWKWASTVANAGTISGLGLYLSVAGLYGTLIGFTLALEQIRKGTSASEAAESALIDIKSKLSSLNASGEIERARFALEEAERSVYAGRIKELKFSLAPARQCFLKLTELDLDIFSDLNSKLEASVEEMSSILDKADEGDKDYIKNVAGYVRTYIDLTSRMQVRITRG